MRKGGEPRCLPSISDYEIAIQEDFEAVDRGYAESEKGSRKTFITICMILILISILLLGFCIYRSMMQKRARLEQLVQKESI